MSGKKEIVTVTRDFESEFLKEVADKYAYWKAQGQNDYATAYLVILHNFTNPNKG